MKFFWNKEKVSEKQKILETKIQLEQLKDKYANMVEIQRRILRKDPTPHEKEVAAAKIRSGICAYAICMRTSAQLDEISSELELNRSLRELGRSLQAVNKISKKASMRPATKTALSREIGKLSQYDPAPDAEKIFSEANLATVDEWLGSRWDSVVNKFIGGMTLSDCVNESRYLLETDPVPFEDEELFGENGTKKDGVSEDMLSELLRSDIF